MTGQSRFLDKAVRFGPSKGQRRTAAEHYVQRKTTRIWKGV